MAVIKCKMCGGDLILTEGQFVAQCEYCGSRQTVPAADNEKKLTLFGRANRLRATCDFDKAAGIYETIVADFPEEAEAYWGLVLCKYGIEYVDDPATGKKIPTCHRSSFDSVMEDSDFEQAMENAEETALRVYREEAKQIEKIRKGILEVSSNEQPYDVFICYKETDTDGNRTVDSLLAQDIYDALTANGYRVFFSRITLEDKLGHAYEPYIFAALNSAKVMLAVGTCYEHYNAVWVKNEWSRYLKIIAQDKNKYLIPCYKGIDAYDIPKEFAHLQGQDMGKVGAIQDLLRGIEKLIVKEKPAVQPVAQVQAEDINRAFIYNSALEKAEEKKIKSVEAALEKLETISGYSDTDQQIERLKRKLKKLKTKRLVKWLVVVFLIAAIVLGSVISSAIKEQQRLAAEAQKRIENYQMGVTAMEEGRWEDALAYLGKTDGYEDSAERIETINQWKARLSKISNEIYEAGPYISQDGEVLDLHYYNIITGGSNNYESSADGIAPTIAPATEEIPPMVEIENSSFRHFTYEGTFYYDIQTDELQFRSSDGTAYVLAFDGSSITFGPGGQLSGRVYQSQGVYYTEVAQRLLDAGMNYMAAVVVDGVLMSDSLPEAFRQQAKQIDTQASENQESQSALVDQIYSHVGNYDQARMEQLMEASMNGDISQWADVISSGEYLGEILWECSFIWMEQYCTNTAAMLYVAQLDPQLAAVLDQVAWEATAVEVISEAIAAGIFV